ncbi:MAG: rhodanese-like domain-containing protein [Desulfobacterales bacterium]|jgi:rhodanese-related sulfurtransferase
MPTSEHAPAAVVAKNEPETRLSGPQANGGQQEGAMGIGVIEKEALAETIAGKKVAIVDVRANWASSQRKIPGAVHKPADRVADWAGDFDPKEPIVVYCASPKENDSRAVAGALEAAGFEDVSVLSGGWWVWDTAGLPTGKRKKDPLPRGVIPGVTKP